MNGSKRLNLDTSVLFNFVNSSLPGEIEVDKGSHRLLTSADYLCVIGRKVNEEFNALCNRRYALYDDLLEWLTDNPDKSIYEYDPVSRGIHASDHDITHIRYDVQHEWAEDSREQQLSDIRKCQQDLGNFQELIPRELLDQIFAQLDANQPLLDALDELCLNHDKEVIVDAVEINRDHGIDTLVAIDSDITSAEQKQAIREAIRRVDGEGLVLVIVSPADV